MKKRLCRECGIRMTEHRIGRVNGRVEWICPFPKPGTKPTPT